ncbi:MAG: serine/threonine-protein phosphatase [Acidimicrobiia bacterium]|nr:protein phosphatase 2C domain-containing protein [bacterium]MXZ67399.1 serine/threonine-protein phosphatase [Acidimicrobiia bacterium]MYB43686.1 serine/threonine-protein phosphatase [Acidimicrobiia bacterium]MYC84992.1 serine/threonine-protein phosphatase [Acidimicrobiia bacterium]
MRFVWASGSDTGRRRPKNEDSIHPKHDGRTSGSLMVAVADGMGGHHGGDVASSLAIKAAARRVGTPEERVRAANDAIMERVLEDPRLAGMGTTLTVAELRPDGEVTLGHVGDSRAYRWRAGRFEQVTIDHTFVQEEVEAGRLTPEQARHHPERSLLTRALGFEHGLVVEVARLKVSVGDRLLLCSDGLTSMVTDDRIAGFLESGAPSEVVWALIEAANRSGGLDNVSVIVVAVAEDEASGD